MNKKGSHVDWVISMSIFILGVLTIIIFIIPLTSKPLYSKEILLPIVEEKFQEDYYWTVKVVPLFVGSAECKSATISFENNWQLPLGGLSVTEVDPLLNSKIEYVLHNTNLEPDPFYAQLTTSSPCGGPDNVYLGAEENKFGLSSVFLARLFAQDYNKLKKSWNFPFANDFAIYVNNQKVIGPDPPNNINIFVNQFRDFMIDENGDLQEVLVSLRAW